MSQRQTNLLRLLLLCPLAFSSSSHTGKCYTRGGILHNFTTTINQSRRKKSMDMGQQTH